MKNNGGKNIGLKKIQSALPFSQDSGSESAKHINLIAPNAHSRTFCIIRIII